MIGLSLSLPRQGGGGGSVTPLVVVQDSFTNDGASAVDLDSRPPDVDYVGSGWTVTDGAGGTFFGTQDVLANDSFRFIENGSSGGLALVDCGITTGVAAKTVSLAGQYARWVHFIPRYVDPDNYFIIAARVYDGAGNAEAGIVEKTSGVLTQRAVDLTAGSSPSPGDLAGMWFQDDGSRLSVGFIDSGGVAGSEALGYNTAVHFGGSVVGFSCRALASPATSSRMDIDEFTVISTPDYTQLP